MRRVAVYIDGFNFYYGLKSAGGSTYRELLWLDFHALSSRLIRADQTLAMVKYFTARVARPPEKQDRQRIFLQAVEASGVQILEGQYQDNRLECRQCGSAWFVSKEKQTDVRIAVEMLKDATLDRWDTAMLVTGDSDLLPPIQALKEMYPGKRILVAFPPDRHKSAVRLKQEAHGWFIIKLDQIRSSQLPDPVRTSDGYELHRPRHWSVGAS